MTWTDENTGVVYNDDGDPNIELTLDAHNLPTLWGIISDRLFPIYDNIDKASHGIDGQPRTDLSLAMMQPVHSKRMVLYRKAMNEIQKHNAEISSELANLDRFLEGDNK